MTSSSKRSLDDVLSSLSDKKKKQKLTTLEKTKQDWQNFKQQEGIVDELKEQAKNG